MTDLINSLLDIDWFGGPALSFIGRPGLVMIALDATSGLSYLSIAGLVVAFASRPGPLPWRWMYWCFACCMAACGAEHLIAIGAMGLPASSLGAYAKGFAALLSLFTALSLWPLLSRVLNPPTSGLLQRAYLDLAERVAERDLAVAALEQACADRNCSDEMLRQSQKVDAVGQIAGGLAHDFNNLLGVIVGNLDRASRLMAAGTKPHKGVMDAMSAADRAATLVSRLMAFARREPPKLAHVPIDTLIAGLQPLIAGLAPGCDVRRLRVLLERARRCEPTGKRDPQSRLNASDAMARGGILTIRTRAFVGQDIARLPLGDCVLIEIEDTGTGMSADIAAKIFDAFFTTKALGFGTGLGLSQVAVFVRQSGGAVRLHSEVGKGTRIELYLPRSHGAPELDRAALEWASQPNTVSSSPLPSPGQRRDHRSEEDPTPSIAATPAYLPS